MADSTKKEKIAAAKKKLKQFQQKSSSEKKTNKENRTSNTKADLVNAQSEEKNRSQTAAQSKLPDSSGIKINQSTTSVKDLSSVSTDSNQFDWFDPTRTTASTESLHQLSQQINGLLTESQVYMNGDDVNNTSIAELEKRNQELAALLEKHSQANEQLNTQLQQTKLYAQNIQNQLDQERNGFDEKHKKDVGSLREQLQVHIQTIGILVAEKTELQSQLGQSHRISEQRLQELEEISGRLKASRQRVSDLEKNVNSSTQSSQQHEKLSRETAKEVDRLKLELYKANKSKEEYQEQLSELKEKLTAKVSECSGLDQSVSNLKKKLEMAELYAKQLSNENENSEETVQILAELQQEKGDLLMKIQQYDETFQKMSEEKEQISYQYQQYVSQIQRQAEDQHKQVTSLSEERNKLLARQHELECAVHELQQKLENIDVPPTHTEVDNTEYKDEISRLKTEYQELISRHEAQIRDNAQLSRFLEEKEERINELETTVNTLGEEAGDKAQLLESIQSDKTALSRALTQNKDLKNQLAELQSCFVKMTNDNMELLTKLQSGEHQHQDVMAKLGRQEDELTEIKQQVARKDSELNELRNMSKTNRIDEYQQEQINDRLQHYEAQAQLVDTLQNELRASQDMVDALTTQSSELRAMLIKAAEIPNNDNNEGESENKRDQVLESLSTTIKQLEDERGILVSNLKEQRELSDKLSVRVADLQEQVLSNNQDDADNNRVGRVEFEQLKTAMTMIQDKYTRVMKDKADLSDKADQLEHLVTQLQGESDTIGEYISLYHHQRALLQQRESQKNDYIGHLARDREELQGKLGQLQALVMQLLGERNMLHSYNEESILQKSTENDIQPHLAHKHHHHHHHHHQNGVPNGDGGVDWPDYTSSEDDSDSEVEQIVGGAENGDVTPTQQPSPAPSTPTSDSQSNKSNNKAQEEDQTAHRILHLLSEIGHSNLVEKASFMERNFLPCKYCKGRLMVV
ncbi:golgin subfamily A member 2 isoform X1 [Patella vulgata]|uniref:golgin subfamily A member 2 isoform X1 n=1 Tax=Patella vulgata TaxID=6465 RepID=UPI0024A7B978|nr:golgin subfamily A member 2 isoform X1 [Patella vulgata]